MLFGQPRTLMVKYFDLIEVHDLVDKNPEEKSKTIDQYNASAQFYDRRYDKIQKQKYDLILDDFSNKFNVILDAGCGTGLFFTYLVQEHPSNFNEGMFVGLDISWNMIREFNLKTLSSMEKYQKRTHLILGDLECLPFRDQVFSQVFSLTTLQNLGDEYQGIQELIDTSKEGAQIGISRLNKEVNAPEMTKFLSNNLELTKIITKSTTEDIFYLGIKK